MPSLVWACPVSLEEDPVSLEEDSNYSPGVAPTTPSELAAHFHDRVCKLPADLQQPVHLFRMVPVPPTEMEQAFDPTENFAVQFDRPLLDFATVESMGLRIRALEDNEQALQLELEQTHFRNEKLAGEMTVLRKNLVAGEVSADDLAKDQEIARLRRENADLRVHDLTASRVIFLFKRSLC